MHWHRLLNGEQPEKPEPQVSIDERLKKAFRSVGKRPSDAGESDGEK